jgi:predicted CopG family antitoxin
MTTTISVTEDIREKIKEFGHKGETYSEILTRLIRAAQEQQLKNILMDTTDTIPIDNAITRAKKRWRTS